MNSKLFVISLCMFCFVPFLSGQEVNVLSSGSDQIILEYIPQYSLSEVEHKGKTYTEIHLQGGSTAEGLVPGAADIPAVSLNLGVPSETGNIIQIRDIETYQVEGRVIPVPQGKKDNNGFVNFTWFEGENYSEAFERETVTFGVYGYMRDLPVQALLINPVSYDPASGIITLAKKVVFSVEYGKTNRTSSEIPLSKKSSYVSVINFDASRRWGVKRSMENRAAKISSAPLSEGTWYKFTAPEEGIYKIDRNMLSSYGIDPSSVDPRTIKIYNNGGYELPENITLERTNDLTENAIFVSGEADGKFDEGDYILFYGRGTRFPEYDAGRRRVNMTKHTFSENNYYFITSGGSYGKRMESFSSEGNTGYTQRNTQAVIFNDDDKYNLNKSGRLYVGDEFSSSNKSRTYVNSLHDFVPGSSVRYKVNVINYSDQYPYFSIEENGQSLKRWRLSRADTGWENEEELLFSGAIPDSRSVFKMTLETSNPEVVAYLDYFQIEYQRSLNAIDDQVVFFSKDTTASIKYDLRNFSNSSVLAFDVTDFSSVKVLAKPSTNGSSVSFGRQEERNSVKKYIALCNSKLKKPGDGMKVENSFIRADNSGADYLIITNKKLASEVERYKTYRENESKNPLSVKVAYVEDILNEFNSGMLDPTAIRDFIKYAYDNWENRPFYLLFFGDGVYDYLEREGSGKNLVPTYQTRNSFDEVDSYSTDDFYMRVSGPDDYIDFAGGRINVRNLEDAKSIIDKIIEYENNPIMGVWHNKITLVADDSWTTKGNDGNMHTTQSENVSGYLPDYVDQKKIYLYAYPTVTSGSGKRKPGVNQAIIDAVNNGTLFLNFIGHGNPDTWTHEYVYERTVTIPKLTNSEYFFLVAATCDFGRFDDPNRVSGTEEMMLMRGAGSIGTIAASRSVYAYQNAALAYKFYQTVYSTVDSEGKPADIGTIWFNTKNTFEGSNDNSEHYYLFADPALRLNIPQNNVVVEKVNGIAVDTADINIKALQKVKVEGSVKDPATGQPASNFNGASILSVFDSQKKVNIGDGRYFIDVNEQGGVLFRGQVSVTNGKFVSEFTVPKDISYDNNYGKIVSYIYNSNEKGIGYSDNVIIGGTDSTTQNDGTGPEIELYFDDKDNINNYLVNPDFTLFVKLADETGLNTTGTGVGHKLEAIIDGDEENAIDLTSYFIGDLDSGGKSGEVKYRFSALDAGSHTIEVKAWDVFNNLTKKNVDFSVIEDGTHLIKDVYNYPNPFVSDTWFTFSHNIPGASVNARIRIYTVAGRLIRELEENMIPGGFVKVYWDGRDEDGDIVANGTYLYKLSVESGDTEIQKSVLGKLAIIR